MAADYSHVIFDLDGTILNTLEDLAAAGNHTCEMHGWPTFAVDEYRYKVGNGMLKLVERFMPAEYAGDGRMFEQTLAEFRAYYGEHKEDHTAPYAGTIEMLDRLRAAGVQLAVLTNKDHVSAAPLIEKYFGSERFALVQGRVDAFPPKPDAPVTLHVMEELGADPSTTLYVGDSNVDILTGHNAGLKSAGVSWGFRGRAELEAAGRKFPIKVPVNYNTSSTTWANCTVVLEQQLEELLGADFIDIIVVPYSGSGSFLGETRRNGNYALQELNWGADFMDPETWADPFDHKNSYNFFCNETLEQDGINQYTKTEETAALIDQYFELVAAAREETGDMDARYEAFAAAESFYIDHAIVVPGFISGGSYQATRLNGFEGQYAMMGQSSSRYKGQHVYKTAMSQDMFDAQYAEWTAAMEG